MIFYMCISSRLLKYNVKLSVAFNTFRFLIMVTTTEIWFLNCYLLSGSVFEDCLPRTLTFMYIEGEYN